MIVYIVTDNSHGYLGVFANEQLALASLRITHCTVNPVVEVVDRGEWELVVNVRVNTNLPNERAYVYYVKIAQVGELPEHL